MNLGAFYLPFGLTVVQLGLLVTAAGSVGATGTPLIYADDGTGQPGTLALAGPALDVTATGAKLGAAAATLPPGWYWGGALTLGAPTTLPTYQAGTANNANPAGGIAVATNADTKATAFSRSGQAAPPNPAGAVATNVNIPDLFIGT